jgi:hypothetical protein
VQDLVTRLGSNGAGVFAKISCRSAKDALSPDTLANLYHRYVDEVKKYIDSSSSDMADNLRLIALTRAGTGNFSLPSITYNESVISSYGYMYGK